LERMLVNTDDAYGFPPFRYLAPAITIGGRGYAELREREREILSGFLSQVRTRVLASDCFGWADEIPRLLRDEPASVVLPDTVSRDGARAFGLPSDRFEIADRSDEIDAWPRWGGQRLLGSGGRL